MRPELSHASSSPFGNKKNEKKYSLNSSAPQAKSTENPLKFSRNFGTNPEISSGDSVLAEESVLADYNRRRGRGDWRTTNDIIRNVEVDIKGGVTNLF